jgi:hypothetical protein
MTSVTLQVVLKRDVTVGDVTEAVNLLGGRVTVAGGIELAQGSVTFLDGALDALRGTDGGVIWLSPEDVDGFKLRMMIKNVSNIAADAIVAAICQAFDARPSSIDNRLALGVGPLPTADDSSEDLSDYYGFGVIVARKTYSRPNAIHPDDVSESLFKCSRCKTWTPPWDLYFGAECDTHATFYARLAHVVKGGSPILCGECKSETDALQACDLF